MVVVVVFVGGESRLTGSLVSSEGALKRFKFAVPVRRMRAVTLGGPTTA